MTVKEAVVTLNANVVVACERARFDSATVKMIEDALDTIEDALKEREWISVKDRLPDNKDRYLCACFDYVTKTYWIDILWHVSGSWWTRLSSMDTDKNANDHVRYWMPLTEPPKEDKDDDE